MNRCISCKFFVHDAKAAAAGVDVWGSCRRYPSAGPGAGVPWVHQDEWCGEHRQRLDAPTVSEHGCEALTARIEEWIKRIMAARHNNDTPAFDKAVMDGAELMRAEPSPEPQRLCDACGELLDREDSKD